MLNSTTTELDQILTVYYSPAVQLRHTIAVQSPYGQDTIDAPIARSTAIDSTHLMSARFILP